MKLNIVFRAAILCSRFLLIYLLSEFGSFDLLGEYSINASLIILLVYMSGLELYTYTNRNIISQGKSVFLFNFKLQCIVSIGTYLISVPLLVLYLSQNGKGNLSLMIVPIFLMDHISTELSRYLVSLGKILSSTIVTFIRTALWVFLLLLQIVFFGKLELESVFYFWCTFSFLSIVIAISIIKKEIRELFVFSKLLDFSNLMPEIYRAIKFTTPFFLTAISIKFMLTIDKMYLEKITSIELVGYFAFIFALSSVVSQFFESTISPYFYPGIIKSISNADSNRYKKITKDMLISSFVYMIFFWLGFVILLDYFLVFINKSYLLNFKKEFYVLLFSASLTVISTVFHYSLYAFGKGILLLKISLISLVIFMCSLFFLDIESPLLGLSFSHFIYNLTNLVLKFWFSRNLMVVNDEN